MNKIECLLHTLAPKGVEFKTLEEVFEIRNGYTPSKNNPEFWKNGTIPWFRMEDIRENGRILKDSIQHITPKALKGEKLFPKNSIIISTTATIGEHALLIVDSLANQQFTFLSKKANCDIALDMKFFFYQCFLLGEWCKNNTNVSGFASVDMTAFKKYKFPIPPLEIQQEIVKILDAFTELNTELNARKKQYQYYQNMLLDFDDINQNRKDAKERLAQKPYPKRLKTLLHTLAPKGVGFRKLGEVLEYDQPNQYCVTSKEFDKSYPTPVLTAGKTFILGYTNEKNNIYQASKSSPVIIFDDFTTATQWVDFPFKVKSSAMKILLPKNPIINIRFIFFYMQTIPYNIGGEHARHWISRYSQLEVPIPPLEIQQEIVKILDQFSILTTDLLAGIPAEIEARKKQYEYYREKLLTFKPSKIRHNMNYETIAESNESTVVAEFHSDNERKSAYESEAELERAFIKLLEKQGYEFKQIHNEQELKDNLKEQLEKLNDHYFTPKEWDTLYFQFIANKNEDYKAKTKKIQEDPIFNLTLENGKTKNIKIIDKKNIHRNALQVIHQYSNKGGKYQNRYDVSILVNGLPLVHVELKKRGVAIREAFNQIKRYKRDSFSAEDGLFEFVQIFVISNGTSSKYYSNTTRIAQLEKNNKADTFEFTNYWADSKNHNIEDLMDFAKAFFAKRSLLNILTCYCVFTSEEVLLVMRPYQIVAAERILEKIKAAQNSKTKSQSGGYIWHTTGSGKTLTSFKSAALAKELEGVSKVLFVVDRKDLDYQTMKEYDKFQKDCANSNTSTKILKQQLEDPSAKIIITTIQKLDKFVKAHLKGHAIFNEEVVMIFDECHRSQLGSMHQMITKAFKKYHLFGFTGTPIFAQNCDKNNPLGTTEQKFGTCLHQYTIIDAIRDKNVLPFRVEYHNTIKAKEGIKDKEVRAVDEKNALLDTRRIKEIAKCIVERFNQTTKNKKFNSILACSGIEALKKYYQAFKEEKHNLKIATIFSYSANEEIEALEDENNESACGLDKSSRDFLEGAIADYNGMFKTSFDTSDQKFQSYYKYLSQKMKDREIDLLMVVNMFLTGFDATRLNTLWVDKNLKYHGLIQAFSRTNRILDSVKTHGNIVCFRDLEQDLNDALMLFGNKDTQSIALLRKYEDYLKGYVDENKEYEGYEGLIGRLLTEFPLKEPIISESQKKDFIKLFGKILKLENILNSFENFNKDDHINPRDFQDYQSKYLDFYDEMRPEKGRDKEEINDDLIFEIELIKQVEVNIDYILNLIEKFAKEHGVEIQGVKTKIEPIINSSIELRNKKDLIMGFIDKYNKDEEVHAYFQSYIHQKREEEFQNIIKENRLNEEKAYSFMQHAFRRGEIDFIGTKFPEIIEEKVSRFSKNSRYQEVKEKVAASLSRFFHCFCDLTSAIFKKNGIKKDEINEK